MLKFPVTVDEFNCISENFVREVAYITTKEEYDRARTIFIGNDFTFYNADGKVIL